MHCLRGARILRRKGLCPLVAVHLAILVGCRLTAVLAQRKALVETGISALWSAILWSVNCSASSARLKGEKYFAEGFRKAGLPEN